MKILRNKVYFFILKLVKDPTLAEDITQDIILKAWERKDKILGMENADFYVFKMAKNAVMDHFKKLAKEKSLKARFTSGKRYNALTLLSKHFPKGNRKCLICTIRKSCPFWRFLRS